MLLEKFTEAGIAIQEDFQFKERDIQFTADGYDDQKAVGYEYISFNDWISEWIPIEIEDVEALAKQESTLQTFLGKRR